MAIREMDWEAHIGQRVRIYRNLNNGRMSIQAKDKTWKVVGHVLDAVLEAVTLRVSEAGRQRVIRENRKNIHAWGEGTLIGAVDESIFAPIDLAYNPYLSSSFCERGTDHSITGCNFLVVRNNRVSVSPDAVGEPSTLPTLTLLNGGQGSKHQIPRTSKSKAIAA